jgi:hypothetical protein
MLVMLQGPQMPPEVVEIVKMFFTTVAVVALGIPIIRAFTRRFERGPQLPPAPSPEVVARLERIEQSIEAVAVEVERIAEAQRFSAKLAAEQARALPRN